MRLAFLRRKNPWMPASHLLFVLALAPTPAAAQADPQPSIPPAAVPYVQAGISQYRQGNYFEAAAALRKARDLLPGHPEVSRLLGTSLLLADQYEAARAEFLRFLRLDPAAIEPRLGLARIAVRLGESEEAIRRYREVLAQDPKHDVALYNLGWLHLRAGQYELARDHLLQMLARNPGHAAAHHTLGAVFDRMGDATRAEEEFRRAVALEPDHVKAHYHLMNLYRRTGRMDEARREEEIFLRLAERDATDRAAEAVARDRFLAGDFGEALAEYERLLAQQPDSARFHLGRGMCLLEMGRFTEALPALERSVELDPRLPDAHYHLAVLYQRLGEPEKSHAARQRYESLEAFGVSQY